MLNRWGVSCGYIIRQTGLTLAMAGKKLLPPACVGRKASSPSAQKRRGEGALCKSPGPSAARRYKLVLRASNVFVALAAAL